MTPSKSQFGARAWILRLTIRASLHFERPIKFIVKFRINPEGIQQRTPGADLLVGLCSRPLTCPLRTGQVELIPTKLEKEGGHVYKEEMSVCIFCC
jgi:hypothetical protein